MSWLMTHSQITIQTSVTLAITISVRLSALTFPGRCAYNLPVAIRWFCPVGRKKERVRPARSISLPLTFPEPGAYNPIESIFEQ